MDTIRFIGAQQFLGSFLITSDLFVFFIYLYDVFHYLGVIRFPEYIGFLIKLHYVNFKTSHRFYTFVCSLVATLTFWLTSNPYMHVLGVQYMLNIPLLNYSNIHEEIITLSMLSGVFGLIGVIKSEDTIQ